MKKTNQSVKSSIRWAGVMVGVAVLAAGLQSVTAQSIGVHFGNAGGTGSATNTSTDLLLPTDVAGAPGYAQANWNDLGASGDSAGQQSPPVVLTDSTGAATSLSIEWASAGVGSSGVSDSTPDGKLMDGYLSTWDTIAATPLDNPGAVYYEPANDNPLAYVGGLNAWCAAQGAIGYKVVLYTTGGPYYESAEGYVESVASGDPFSYSMVEGSVLTPPLIDVYSSTYSGTFVPITSTNSSSPTYGGNYMVFAGLTNDAILIRFQFLTSYGGAGLNGFQIVPIYPALASVGVHFGNQGGTGYATNSSTDLLLATDSAGVADYAQANWNNLGASGDSGGINTSGQVVLTDSTGAATSLSVMWSSAGYGSTGTAAGLGTPDGKLMDGYLASYAPGVATPLNGYSIYYNSANDNPLAYVGGLNAWCQGMGAAGYDVVLYTTGNTYNERAEGFLESVTGSPFSWNVAEGDVLRPPLFAGDSANFSGTYVPAAGTSTGSATFGANYMEFYGLTNDAILIRLQSLGYGAGLNGFQIIPVAPLPLVVPPVVTINTTNTGGATNVVSWNAGTLQTATNVLGPWTYNYNPSPFTDTMTNAALFYRAWVQP